MKLWEVKAQALRLMFADSDLQFSEEEFSASPSPIYTNPNTSEKLVRMNDSIRRGIDLYYQYNEQKTQWVEKPLMSAVVSGVTTYYNKLDLSQTPTNMGFPTRIDIIKDTTNLIFGVENIQFTYDEVNKIVYFIIDDYTHESVGQYIKFRVFYKMSKVNIPSDANELTYDLTASLSIPEEIQRQLPLYVKYELYEEDEPQLAQQAKSDFIQFLIINQRSSFSNVQTKVKKTFKRNFNV